jgi:Zn-dependent protease
MPVSYALVIFELVVMVLSISLHDCAQAWMANRLGDPTARMMGRLTINPLQHYSTAGHARLSANLRHPAAAVHPRLV